MNKTALRIFFALLFVAIVIFFSYTYIQHQETYPSTDDAYIKSNIVNIAPQITGRVLSVAVKDNQAIKAGTTLFTIDPRPFEIAFDRANNQLKNTVNQVKALNSAVTTAAASVKAQQAVEIEAVKNYRRISDLYKKRIVPSNTMDQATSQLNQAKAQLKASQAKLAQAQNELGQANDRNAQIKVAQADVAQAKLNLSHTIIKAPAAGIVSNLSLRPGDEVTTAQNVFALIESNHWWAQANFKETQLDNIRPGQPASIKLDMYPDEPIQGIVESVGSGSGDTFSLLPAENATGNWVKVTKRFPVRIKINTQQQAFKHDLRVGASCTVTIDTTKGS